MQHQILKRIISFNTITNATEPVPIIGSPESTLPQLEAKVSSSELTKGIRYDELRVGLDKSSYRDTDIAAYLSLCVANQDGSVDMDIKAQLTEILAWKIDKKDKHRFKQGKYNRSTRCLEASTCSPPPQHAEHLH